MQGADITLTVGIVVVYLLAYASIALAQGIAHVKANWSIYKCHPAIIPTASIFGHNPEKNLVDCVSSIGNDGFSFLTTPIMHLLNGAHSSISSISNTMNKSSNLFSMFSGTSSGGFSGMFSIFSNVLVSVQSIVQVGSALIHGVFGIMTIIENMITSMSNSAQSIWNGYPGKAIKFLAHV
tara:strand:- start:1653 stop:2192 length:540 start_codon:yes stop_codon:yes gene_type:complete